MVGGSLNPSARAAGSVSKVMLATATGASAASRPIMFLSESFRRRKYSFTVRIMSSHDDDGNARMICCGVIAVRDGLSRRRVGSQRQCRPNGLSSGFEDGKDLSFDNHIVETDENRFEFSRRRCRDRDFHLHRFDEYDVIAIADASPDLDRERADAPGDLGHNLDVWHSVLRDSLRAYGDRNTRKYRNARKSKGGRPRLVAADCLR